MYSILPSEIEVYLISHVMLSVQLLQQWLLDTLCARLCQGWLSRQDHFSLAELIRFGYPDQFRTFSPAARLGFED